ncbi:MAG TPA: VOC family protein [Candidatus Limnocylindrales bacterium]|nr:VOC family protein [Candidatus Limnocylindrales bacterium]
MIQRLGFLGVRTATAADFDATVALYRDVLGLPPILERADAVWFEASDRTQIHVYGPGEDDHDFFTSGPVVGLVVADFFAAREAMVAAGIEFIGEPQEAGPARWNHYVGPDGNVYEIMGTVATGG